MKKSIYILLTLLVCFCLPLHAYEYFTIYYIDGTMSEPFYATDVESIEYSKIDLDGIEHADWQVQEIHTVDSIYRYSLASIKYIDFKDVDENVVAHDIATVSKAIAPLFNECQSALQLSERLSVIQNINGVEDAYISNQTLFVKIRDWGYLSFLYPTNDSVTDDEFELVPKNNETNLRRSNRTNEHQHTEVLKACVVNQQFRDDNRKFFQTIAEQFRVSFADMGIDPKIVNMPSPDFFQNEMFDYDILFIKTHGSYDEKSNLHWLCTGEELLTKDPQYGLSDTQIGSLINQILLNFHHFAYSSRKMGFSWIPERRNGDSIHVLYTTISDEFISSAKKNFRNAGSAIVFNTACESMKENNKMAQAFEKRGAGCYLGYDDPDRVGGHAGKHFWAHLLVGRSILGAIKAMPDWSKEEKFYIDKNGKEYDVAPSGKITIKCNPKLKIYPSNSSLCITHPKTLSVENPSEDIILKGQMKCAYIQGAYDNMSIGFQYGTSYDMSQAKTIGYENTYYDSSTRYMNWEATLNKSDLQPASTYYYRAYMYDGHSYCYGDIKSFSTKKEAYAVFNDNILTFFYDMKRNERIGEVYLLNNYINSFHDYLTQPSWNNKMTKVVFDSSFADYTPVSTAYWFHGCENLIQIENLCYLNTSNVTFMFCMFSGCSSLKSLDVSHFNTSKVGNMGCMFYGCSSLKSLDVSHFDTSNVTSMGSMFAQCYSLTSLDVSHFDTSNVTSMCWMFSQCYSLKSLDVSHFNTSNVMDMSEMFFRCESLASLDVSHFNTSNVMDMSEMFAGCYSLKSLDVSNFKTSKVKEMRWMFQYCRSLTSLDVSNFNTSNVTDMGHMFDGCRSLTSLNVSHFNTSNVTDMRSMFYNCSSLTSLNVSNFNTSNVTDMCSMFAGCRSLTSLNVSHFNTSNVTDMISMFYNCSSLTSLDVSNFNTSSVTDMSSMFKNCSSLTRIYAGNWKVVDSNNMFIGCNNLTGRMGTKIGDNLYGYDSNGNPLYYYCPDDGRAAHIDGGKDNPGLFTVK